MADIALQGGKVILKEGKASCTCCGCNFGEVCLNGQNLGDDWIAGIAPILGTVCNLRAGLIAPGGGIFGQIDIFVYSDIQVTEIYGFGLINVLSNCCFGTCVAYRQYSKGEHPVYGTYQINTNDCGILQLTLYAPPC